MDGEERRCLAPKLIKFDGKTTKRIYSGIFLFTASQRRGIIPPAWRDGRVVECTGLENRHGFVAHLGFKSLSLRHFKNKKTYLFR